MKKKIYSKILLGTAQFGKPYGINNKKKKSIAISEIRKILLFCQKKNIIHLDTAFGYNFDLSILNKQKKWIIDTKIIINKSKNFIQKVTNKLYLIKKHKNIIIDTIYIHNSEKIFSKNGKLLINLLNKEKKLKLIKYIGVSVYSTKIVKKILKSIDIDVVQVPYNILDRRFEKLFKYFKKKKVKIYARSIFLQGLLITKLKNKFSNFYELKKINNFSLKNNISKLNLCFNFVANNTFVDKILLGVDNLKQLKQIFEIPQKKLTNINELKSSNIRLIDPRNW